MDRLVGLVVSLARPVIGAVTRNLYLRRCVVVTWHALGIYVTYLLAFQIRFDGAVPANYMLVCWNTLPVLLLTYLLFFAVFRLYSGMWTYFSVDDLARVGVALTTATIAFALVILGLRETMSAGVPRSVFVIEFMLMGGWMTGSKFAIRYLKGRRDSSNSPTAKKERVLIVGRLADADLVIRSNRENAVGRIVGILTDDATQKDLAIHGIGILGIVGDVGRVAQQTRASCVLILPPFNRPRHMNEIVRQCGTRGVACTFRTVPSLESLATGEITASSIRTVDIEDLINRGPTRMDRTDVRTFVKGKTVMITGAGGSIGSELCRQIAGYEPETVVLFESSEYALYTIEQDLRRRYPSLTVIPCAADIRHAEEVEGAIDKAGGVDIIYHAAAYKHVPLMEQNVSGCFRTNVLGTARLAQMAIRKGVDRFVMISSDKAVRPTSIMGATKRIAERLITELPKGKTTFVAVRFGNVLESSGSVIPLFKRQIAEGGPVTVTTREVKRFFMTIPEAVDLVLMAGTVGRNGDVMVLEMGESMRIVDLARRLIELSGLVPDKDIRIEFIGLRPGEKEYEEVMTEDENVAETSLDKIWVLNKNAHADTAAPVDLALVERNILDGNDAALRSLAAQYVPENHLEGTGDALGATPKQTPESHIKATEKGTAT